MLSVVIAGAPSCASYERRCHNGVCIPQSWFCDGVADCSDRSDEDNSTCRMHRFICIHTFYFDESNTAIDNIEAPRSPWSQCQKIIWRCQKHVDATLTAYNGTTIKGWHTQLAPDSEIFYARAPFLQVLTRLSIAHFTVCTNNHMFVLGFQSCLVWVLVYVWYAW